MLLTLLGLKRCVGLYRSDFEMVPSTSPACAGRHRMTTGVPATIHFMITFDGKRVAEARELFLRERVSQLLEQGNKINIAAVVFLEDSGSKLYTQHKQDAAERVGVTYTPHFVSITDSPDSLFDLIATLSSSPDVTGVIVQKPTRKVWERTMNLVDRDFSRAEFSKWWSALLEKVTAEKDIDGLSPVVQKAFQSDEWRKKNYVLTATAKSVLISLVSATSENHLLIEESRTEELLEYLRQSLSQKKIIFIGKSELVCKPLHAVFSYNNLDVELLGKEQLEERVGEGKKLLDADVVVSATGVSGLITADMIKTGVILIDVGEPRPDVDCDSVGEKPAFVTPVPGGIGPVTVVSLLENAVDLVR